MTSLNFIHCYFCKYKFSISTATWTTQLQGGNLFRILKYQIYILETPIIVSKRGVRYSLTCSLSKHSNTNHNWIIDESTDPDGSHAILSCNTILRSAEEDYVEEIVFSVSLEGEIWFRLSESITRRHGYISRRPGRVQHQTRLLDSSRQIFLCCHTLS